MMKTDPQTRKAVVAATDRDAPPGSRRPSASQKLSRSEETQAVLNRLLALSLADISLEAMLKAFIAELTAIPWLALESKGAIFLVPEGEAVLELKAHQSLKDSLLGMCARVPFGHCLCGRAAVSRQVEFADGLDGRHDYRYEGITAHGHYCIPILSGSNAVLGVITLYLREGHRRSRRECAFLTAVANTLASIIELKRTQNQLRQRKAELEELNTALRVMLKQTEQHRREIEEHILFNVKELALPHLEKLARSGLKTHQRASLEALRTNLQTIVSPLVHHLTSRYIDLTATEIQVANLVMNGKRTKEIAHLMTVSEKTVEVHRKNIRRKLGIRNQPTDLRAHLLSLR